MRLPLRSARRRRHQALLPNPTSRQGCASRHTHETYECIRLSINVRLSDARVHHLMETRARRNPTRKTSGAGSPRWRPLESDPTVIAQQPAGIDALLGPACGSSGNQEGGGSVHPHPIDAQHCVKCAYGSIHSELPPWWQTAARSQQTRQCLLENPGLGFVGNCHAASDAPTALSRVGEMNVARGDRPRYVAVDDGASRSNRSCILGDGPPAIGTRWVQATSAHRTPRHRRTAIRPGTAPSSSTASKRRRNASLRISTVPPASGRLPPSCSSNASHRRSRRRLWPPAGDQNVGARKVAGDALQLATARCHVDRVSPRPPRSEQVSQVCSLRPRTRPTRDSSSRADPGSSPSPSQERPPSQEELYVLEGHAEEEEDEFSEEPSRRTTDRPPARLAGRRKEFRGKRPLRKDSHAKRSGAASRRGDPERRAPTARLLG